uniref:YvbH-like oligomerization domain-containing protein n=1 Tax=Sporosarcina sp. FSL K6-1522 TaxID=2921554 RepID=UPI00406D374C
MDSLTFETKDGAYFQDQCPRMTEFGFPWLTAVRDQYHIKDFGDMFEKYISN